MENYYADVKPPTKAQERLTQQLDQLNQSVREFNESKKNEKPITGKIMRYCGLCSSELVRTKKSDKLEGLNIEVPRYKCKTCSQVYSGIGLDLYTPNKKGKAICFEYDGTV
jgi:hypothetical protein